ncbi:MAG: DUF5606 domain-containing protein [Bacteroidetes bacterium]|nr:DUF5606 domain-containing protein [Bacteroidota bacterium]
MEYHKIVAVTGLPGLYELLSSKTDGAIVRSLEDKTTKFVSSRIHNFSHLESIEVFTKRENVNLVEVLKSIDSSNEKLTDEKDGTALKNYFTKVYPDIDLDRVYSSDLKKMIKWASILKANQVELKLSEAPVEEESPVVEEAPKEKVAPATVEEPKKKAKVQPTEEQPAAKPKKAATKKPKEESEDKKAAPEAKPKKAAAKKKSDK